jgi:hypothetical protein
MRRGRASTPSLRGALATKQSRVVPWRDSGLLRYARKDEAMGNAVSTTKSVEGDTQSHPRGVFRPSFASSRHPQSSEGAGKTGCRLAPAVHCAKVALQEAAQRHTGEAQHTAFPAQWFDGLCRALPGERCTIAPVALRITDARARLGRHITARLGAQTPGARTTRFCRTQITPVVCATSYAHGCPPCETRRADVTSVHRSSPRVRDDRDTPL